MAEKTTSAKREVSVDLLTKTVKARKLEGKERNGTKISRGKKTDKMYLNKSNNKEVKNLDTIAEPIVNIQFIWAIVQF